MDKEFLMLCQKDTKRIGLCGNYVSEKLDGQRCFWDGGITAGIKIKDVPWANKYDTRKQDFVSNGLWSRLGNKIHAPAVWIAKLPVGILLDGELWAGYEHRQRLMSAIKREDGLGDWSHVRYMVYDSPPVDRMLANRVVTYSGRKQAIAGALVLGHKIGNTTSARMGFGARWDWMRNIPCNETVILHAQHIIPNGTSEAKASLDQRLNAVLAAGGEGLVIKGAGSVYECARSHGCVKIKPFSDAEGVVVGWISGEATDKGSRLLGMMGSLILRLDNGRELQLSGFTDAERQLLPHVSKVAIEHPGERFTEPLELFPTGTRISFKYRGLTADGIPMEARYWRKREDE